MDAGAKLRRYSDQMRDRVQQQSLSEVVVALSDLVLSPAKAFAITGILRRPRVSDQRRARGSEKASSRYVQVVPSVMGILEKAAVILHPKGQTECGRTIILPPWTASSGPGQPGPRKDLYLRSYHRS